MWDFSGLKRVFFLLFIVYHLNNIIVGFIPKNTFIEFIKNLSGQYIRNHYFIYVYYGRPGAITNIFVSDLDDKNSYFLARYITYISILSCCAIFIIMIFIIIFITVTEIRCINNTMSAQ